MADNPILYIHGQADFSQINEEAKKIQSDLEEVKRIAGHSGTELDSMSKKSAGSLAALGYKIKEVQEDFKRAYNIEADLNDQLSDQIGKLENDYDVLGKTIEQALQQNQPDAVIDGFIEHRKNVGELLDKYRSLEKELSTIDAEIEKQGDVFKQVTQKAEEHRASHDRLRNQLRLVKEEMANMLMEAAQSGDGMSESAVKATDAYKELEEKASDIIRILKEIDAEAQMTAQNTTAIQGVVSGMQGVVGVFSAAQGAMAAFGVSSEELQKVQTRVQGCIAAMMGLQSVMKTLSKFSAFRIMLNRIKVSMLGVSASTGAATISVKALWAALRANPLGLILTAITAVVSVIGILIKKHKEQNEKIEEAKKKVEEFKDKVGELGSSPVAKLKKLQSQWNELGDSLAKKKKFIDENKKAFKELGVAVNNVADAENLFIKNTDAFVQAQVQRAIAASLDDDVMAAAKEFIKAKEAYDASLTLYNSSRSAMLEDTRRNAGNPAYQDYDAMHAPYSVRVFEDAQFQYNQDKEAYEKAERELNALIQKQASAAKKAAEILRGAGFNETNGDNNSTKSLTDESKKLQQAYEQALAAYYKNVARMEQQTQWDIEQISIDAMADGLEKTLRQLRLNHKKELAQIDQQEQERIEQWKNLKKKEWEAKHPDKKDEFDVSRLDVSRQRMEQIGREMSEQFDGNVDLIHRKIIDASELVKKGWEDAGEGIATLFSSQYGIQNGVGEEVEILVTPILPDGTVLSEDELEEYIQNTLTGAEDILAADTKGLVIKVGDAGFHGDLGGDALHQMQEEFYDLAQLFGTFDVMRENAIANWSRREEEAMARVLKSTESFTERREELERKRDADLRGLQQKLEEAKTEEERARIKRQIELRKKIYADELAKLSQEETEYILSNSANYQQLLNVTSDASKKLLARTIDDIKKLLAAVRGEAEELPDGIGKDIVESLRNSPEELSDLYNQLTSLQEQAKGDGEFPFASFVHGLEYLKEAEELAAAATKETNEEIRKQLKNASELAKEKGIKQLTKGIAEIADKFGDIGDTLSQLGEAADSGSLRSLGNWIQSISNFTSAVMQGYSTGGWMGAISAGAESMANSIAQLAISIQNTMREMEQAITEATNNFSRQVETLNLTLKDIYDDGFGVAFFDQIRDASANATSALNKYTAIARQLYGMDYVSETEWNGWKKDWEEIRTDLADVEGLFDEYGNINMEVLEAFRNSGLLDAATSWRNDDLKNLIDDALAYWEKYKENLAIIKEHVKEVFGYLGDEAIKSLTDAIINGGDAWETWKSKGSKAIETLGEELMYQLFLAKKFAAFSGILDEIFSGEGEYAGLSYEELAEKAWQAMDRFFEESEDAMRHAQEFGEQWKERAAQWGYNIWSNGGDEENDRSAQAKGIATASQDSVDELNGRMSTVQGHTFNISENSNIIRDNLSAMLSSVRQIEVYTQHLIRMDNDLHIMKSAIDGFELQGIKIRQS